MMRDRNIDDTVMGTVGLRLGASGQREARIDMSPSHTCEDRVPQSSEVMVVSDKWTWLPQEEVHTQMYVPRFDELDSRAGASPQSWPGVLTWCSLRGVRACVCVCVCKSAYTTGAPGERGLIYTYKDPDGDADFRGSRLKSLLAAFAHLSSERAAAEALNRGTQIAGYEGGVFPPPGGPPEGRRLVAVHAVLPLFCICCKVFSQNRWYKANHYYGEAEPHVYVWHAGDVCQSRTATHECTRLQTFKRTKYRCPVTQTINYAGKRGHHSRAAQSDTTRLLLVSVVNRSGQCK
jgi:hypothetical protein